MLDKLVELSLWCGANRQEGGLTVEVAVGVSLLVVMLLAAVDFGSLMNASASLRGATRAGAEYAKANWNGNANATTVLQQTRQQVCGFLGFSLPNGSTSCSPVTPTVATCSICADNTNKACCTDSTTCPTDGTNPCSAKSDPRLLVSVVVGASRNFTPIIPWATFAFPSTVAESTEIRTQ